MTQQISERDELYQKVPPLGNPIPINAELSEIDDSVPEEPDIRAIVKGLCNGQAGAPWA